MNKKERAIRKAVLFEIGKYILDIMKLIFAGIVLTGIFNLTEEKIYVTIVGLAIVLLGSLLGIYIIYISNKIKN